MSKQIYITFLWLSRISSLLLIIVPFALFFSNKKSVMKDNFVDYTFNTSIADIYIIGTILTLISMIFPPPLLYPACCTLESFGLLVFIIVKASFLRSMPNLDTFLFIWVILLAYAPLMTMTSLHIDTWLTAKERNKPWSWFTRVDSETSLQTNLIDHEDYQDEIDRQEKYLINNRLPWWKRIWKSRQTNVQYSKLSNPDKMEKGDVKKEKDSVPKIKHASTGRLIRWAYPEWKLLSVATVALVISSIANLSQPYFFGRIIGVCGQDHPSRSDLHYYALVLLITFAAGGVATGIRGYLFTLVGERLVRDIRIKLFNQIIRQDVSFFDENSTGELMNRLASDTSQIKNLLSVNMSMALSAIGQFFVSLILLFVTSWRLTLIMLAVVPILVVFAVVYGRYTKQYSESYQDALAKAAEIGSESISNIRIVRSFGGEKFESYQYEKSVYDSYYKGALKSVAYGLFIGFILFSFNSAILLVMYEGALEVFHGALDIGSLTSFVFYTLYMAFAMTIMSNLYTDLMSALGASERVFTIFDTEPTIPLEGGIVPAFAPCPSSTSLGLNLESDKDFHEGNHPDRSSLSSGHIEFDNVTFRYPMRTEVAVLTDFSLTIAPQQTVALVGPSGSGKSTVLGLLERFYDIEKGSIKIDGVPLTQIDPQWLHRAIAIVPQEPVLFSGTIRSNILYSRMSANTLTGKLVGMNPSVISQNEEEVQREVEWAGKQANAHDFITSFPEGYDTIVGERGVRLSGGQKQRIAIARALLANPRILLLDEATSALDAESEHLVQEAIDRLMRSRTVIVIAHRLSTVRDADQIAVFSKGQIAALGPHETLMRTCKLYQNLVRRQLQWGDKESSAALSTITSNDDDEEKDFENKTDFNFLETPMKSDPGVALKDADDNGE